MPKLQTSTTATPILFMTFGYINNISCWSLKHMMLCKGPVPGSVESQPTILTANKLSGFITMGSTAFITPVNKTVSISGPITIPIAAGITSETPTFIRFFESAAESYPVLDIPVSGTQQAGFAQLSSMSVTTGDVVQLTKMNLSFSSGPDLLVSDVFYNNMLHTLTSKVSTYGYTNNSVGYNALMFGKGQVYNGSGFVSAALTVEAYGDIALNSLEDIPTELLWSTSLPSTTNFLNVTGSNVYSTTELIANAVATGEAKYIRIKKAAITTGQYIYPELIMQLKVGVNCFFSNPNMVLGQPSTLEQFNLVLL